MKKRTLDEMISYFNQQVSKMDIKHEDKIKLLGMITAIGYQNKKQERKWIPCSERLPEVYGEYMISWTTSYQTKKPFIGIAEYEVTNEWDEKNDRFNGEWLLDDYIKAYENVKVIAWMPLPEPYKGG